MSLITAIFFGAMVLSIWFLTKFKTHLFNTLYKMELDSGNINEFVSLKFNNKIFGTDFTTAGLISCPICMGFWLAAIASIFIGPIYLPIIYFLQMFGFGLIKQLI